RTVSRLGHRGTQPRRSRRGPQHHRRYRRAGSEEGPVTTVLMFPGQSSCHPEMLARIVSAWPPATAVIAEASGILSRDLARHYLPDTPAMLARNRDIQVGVFLCSYLHQRALAARGVHGDLSLGLSLGEYNHLVHIGALDFPAALRLVDARGAAYDDGP